MYPILQELRVIAGKAAADETLAVLLVMDDVANDPAEPHGIVGTITGDTFTQRGAEPAIALVDIEFLRDAGDGVMALGDAGEVRIYDGDTVIAEQIPVEDAKFRALRRLGDTFVAVGLLLEAWRRGPDGTWEAFGPDAAMRAELGATRFEKLDGYSAREIYVAGDNGIIWHYDGTEWTPIQCATNVTFLSVHCGRDGRVYVGGQHATLAIGRGRDFEIVTSNPELAHLWGVAEIDGIVFGALDRALVYLNDEDAFVPDHGAMELGTSFYDLARAGPALWSFGMKDVMVFEDGTWSRIDEIGVA
ncbi:hypothetical protein [Roseivivax isoporae]|uniref:Glutamine cyclotransferase n=1 Tax=Roseivivax isoporae LMG 25204 TaxID=1449351 RepID=X7FBW9_9RHOB|nr:hypothetical protein [Roseivivax isoporae]ETX30243.1 hypothetical protein RISW2_15525 [Roseivivax isoporae LMG 25204]